MNDIKTKAQTLAQKLHFEKIIQILGKPFYKDDKSAIYHGNNLEFFSKIPNNSIDLTFTSPPYNIGKEYESSLPVNEYVD
jgi:adenine-specific DNA-methyltransferase